MPDSHSASLEQAEPLGWGPPELSLSLSLVVRKLPPSVVVVVGSVVVVVGSIVVSVELDVGPAVVSLLVLESLSVLSSVVPESVTVVAGSSRLQPAMTSEVVRRPAQTAEVRRRCDVTIKSPSGSRPRGR